MAVALLCDMPLLCSKRRIRRLCDRASAKNAPELTADAVQVKKKSCKDCAFGVL